MDNGQKQIKRLKKLFNIVKELNFFRQLVIEQQINLPTRIDPYKTEDDEDDQEILSVYMMPYIKPGDQHLDLIEFLIQKIAKNQFDKCLFYEDNPTQFRVKRIIILASRLGLLTQSKFSKNLNFSKVIEGKSGVDPSLKFVYELAKLTKSHLKTKRIEREYSHRQLFLECTYTMNNLINLDINPFSVDFPLQNELMQHEDSQFHINNIEEEINKQKEELGVEQQQQDEEKDQQEINNNEEQIDISLKQLEKDILESYEICNEDLATYKNQLDYFKQQIISIFTLGSQQRNNLLKKIQQQDFDKSDEKIINIDSQFQKYYRQIQQLKEQIISNNSRYNINDRLEDLVERITLLQTQNNINLENNS